MTVAQDEREGSVGMIKSITKDQMIALWDGLPGDTPILWEDKSAEAHWTFREVTGEVENLVVVQHIFHDIGKKVCEWERPANVEQYEKRTGWQILSESPIPVIVLK